MVGLRRVGNAADGPEKCFCIGAGRVMIACDDKKTHFEGAMSLAPGNHTLAKEYFAANKVPLGTVVAIKLPDSLDSRRRTFRLQTLTPLSAFYTPTFLNSSFQNLFFGGLFNGVSDDGEAQFQSKAFLFVLFCAVSPGSQF